MQGADGLDSPETEEAKALLGEGINSCRKILPSYRIALTPDPPPSEDEHEAVDDN